MTLINLLKSDHSIVRVMNNDNFVFWGINEKVSNSNTLKLWSVQSRKRKSRRWLLYYTNNDETEEQRRIHSNNSCRAIIRQVHILIYYYAAYEMRVIS